MIRLLGLLIVMILLISSCKDTCDNLYDPDNLEFCVPLEGNDFFWNRGKIMKFEGDSLVNKISIYFVELFHPMDSMGFTFNINGDYEFYLRNDVAAVHGLDSVFIHEKGKMIVDFSEPYEPDCGSFPRVDASIRYEDEMNSEIYINENSFRCNIPYFIFSRRLNETDSIYMEFNINE